MPFLPGSNDGTLNDTTPVTVVAAPAASTQRQVHWISVTNKDSAAVTLTLNLVNGINTRRLAKVILQVDDNFLWSENLVLDTTSKSVTAVLAGAVATTQPDFVANYGDTT